MQIQFNIICVFFLMICPLSVRGETCDLEGKKNIEAVKQACELMLNDRKASINNDQVVHIYFQLIKIAYRQHNYIQGVHLLEQLKTEYPQSLENKLNHYQWFYELGKINVRTAEYSAAIENFQQSLDIAQSLNLTEKSAFSLNALGLSYKKNAQYQKSLTAYLKSLKYKEIIGDTESVANTLMNIGDVYYFLEEYNNSLNTYLKARKKYLVFANTLDGLGWENLAHCHENIGIIYYQLGRYDDSISSLQKSLEVLKIHALIVNKATVYTYLAMSYQSIGEHLKSLEYFEVALDEDRKNQNNNMLLRYQLANYHWQEEAMDQAERFVDQGLQMASANEQHINILPDLYLLKSQLLHHRQADELAMESLRKHYDLKEKLLTEKFNQSTQNVLHDIEIAQSQHEMQLLEKDNRYKAVNINRQYWIILSISLMAFMFGLYVWYQFRLRRREKELLLGEIAGHQHKLSKLEGSKHQLKYIYADRSEGVLCTDSGGVVAFFNEPFADLFNLNKEWIGGVKLSDLLPSLAAEVNQLQFDFNDMPKNTKIKNFHVQELEPEKIVNIKVETIYLLDDYTIFLIESAVDDLSQNPPEEQEVLKFIDEILKNNTRTSHLLPLLQEKLSIELVKPGTAEPFRNVLVELMQTCVTVWSAHTKTNRIELADVSGIWRISIDDGRLRTRSMDKYLNIKHLPKNPRWRQVVKTAHFILSDESLSKQNREQLRTVLNEFLAGMKSDWSC